MFRQDSQPGTLFRGGGTIDIGLSTARRRQQRDGDGECEKGRLCSPPGITGHLVDSTLPCVGDACHTSTVRSTILLTRCQQFRTSDSGDSRISTRHPAAGWCCGRHWNRHAVIFLEPRMPQPATTWRWTRPARNRNGAGPARHPRTLNRPPDPPRARSHRRNHPVCRRPCDRR